MVLLSMLSCFQRKFHLRCHVSNVIKSKIGQERIDSRKEESAQSVADLILECSEEAGNKIHDHSVEKVAQVAASQNALNVGL